MVAARYCVCSGCHLVIASRSIFETKSGTRRPLRSRERGDGRSRIEMAIRRALRGLDPRVGDHGQTVAARYCACSSRSRFSNCQQRFHAAVHRGRWCRAGSNSQNFPRRGSCPLSTGLGLQRVEAPPRFGGQAGLADGRAEPSKQIVTKATMLCFERFRASLENSPMSRMSSLVAAMI